MIGWKQHRYQLSVKSSQLPSEIIQHGFLNFMAAKFLENFSLRSSKPHKNVHFLHPTYSQSFCFHSAGFWSVPGKWIHGAHDRAHFPCHQAYGCISWAEKKCSQWLLFVGYWEITLGSQKVVHCYRCLTSRLFQSCYFLRASFGKIHLCHG